jgi:CubicO group peptidase (beta-lactamase class C family)
MLHEPHLSEYIVTSMQKANVPGLAIAVIEDKEIIYHQVFGVQNTQTRPQISENTQFQAASLSKPVFAYAVLKLCEQRLLELDRPLSNYWPEVYSPDEPSLKITPRHVLSHTTGFPNWHSDSELRLETAPGEEFGYSGEGYEYLQRVVEHLTQQPLHIYLQNHLLEPLGMNNSTFVWGSDEAGNILLDEDGNVLPTIGPIISNAAYSLLTTASDYAHFLLAMLKPQDDHPYQLNEASITAMLTPQVQVGQYPLLAWGLGWGLQQIGAGEAFWHWGGPQNNYTNYCFVLKEQRLGVVILTNHDDGLEIFEEIAQVALGNSAPHPAFEWILPIEKFDSRGHRRL